jgi:hypothetical protein
MQVILNVSFTNVGLSFSSLRCGTCTRPSIRGRTEQQYTLPRVSEDEPSLTRSIDEAGHIKVPCVHLISSPIPARGTGKDKQKLQRNAAQRKTEIATWAYVFPRGSTQYAVRKAICI